MDSNKEKSILSKWASLKKAAENEAEKPKEDKLKFKASEGQKRLFFLDQLNPESHTYNLTEIWHFDGKIDANILQQSFEKVASKQHLLRSRFIVEEKEIYIKIESGFNVKIEYFDFTENENNEKEIRFESVAKRISSFHFDLKTGPLLQLALCKFEAQHHKLVINIHHIISDKMSMHILRNELAEVYACLNGNDVDIELKGLKSSFSDYIEYQDNKKVSQETADYWQNKLKGNLEKLELPSDINAAGNHLSKGKYVHKHIDLDLFHKIKSYCKEQRITSFTFFLGVFKLLLSKYTGSSDIILGTPISTRSKTEFEDIIGFFNDSVVLRTQINKALSFKNLIKEINKTILDAFKHKNIGFEEIISLKNPDRSEGGNPLFDIMFLYHKVFDEKDFGKDLAINVSNYDMGVAKFAFTLYVAESENDYELIVEYDTGLYSERFVQQFLDYLITLSTHAIDSPERSISEISYLTKKEIRELITKGSGEEIKIPEDIDLVENIFHGKNKNDCALVDEYQSITYEELNHLSNALGKKILEVSQSQKCVAILLEQSANAIVAMMGCIKSGVTYLPLDVSYPQSHIEYAIKNSGADTIITSKKLEQHTPLSDTTIFIEDLTPSESLFKKKTHKDDNVYIIFTSGSTGNPNGVAISKENLYNSTQSRFAYYDQHPSSYLLLSSISFDSSVAGIYWTLFNGGKIVIPSRSSVNDLDIISNLMDKYKVTHTLLIPSLYDVYLNYIDARILNQLECVILAGEVLPISLASSHLDLLPATKLYNEYGPTEATVWSSAYEIKEKPKNSVPIGIPIPGLQLFIMDSHNQLVGNNLFGELCISGKSVSKGYINNIEKTQSKFINCNIDNKETRIYKTGDWVKWDDNGNLIFLGRKDHQIKVRGYRVELGEIDACIENNFHQVKSKTVYNQELKILANFYIAENNQVDKERIKAHIKSKLPKQYLPDQFIKLNEFPKMSNGKINIKQLETNVSQSNLHQNQDQDSNNNEHIQVSELLKIWKEVLQNNTISKDDNFFELGGDSIQIIRIVAKAKKSGIKISAKDIYNHQTVAQLSKILKLEENTQKTSNLEWTHLPLSPIQEWFFNKETDDFNLWLQAQEITLKSSIDYLRIEKAIQKLLASNDIFTTAFKKEYGRWIQTKTTYSIDQYIHFSEEPLVNINYQFDISNKPLIQFYITANNQLVSKVQIVAHHLIIDAISWSLLLNSFEDHLENRQTNQAIDFNSYFKWISRTKQLSDSNYFLKNLEFWRSNDINVDGPFIGLKNGLEKDFISFKYEINPHLTSILTERVRNFSDINVHELLVACFLKAFYNIYKKNRLSILLEHHGRMLPQEIDIDLSNTIGWHTSLYPLVFTLNHPEDMKLSLLEVKECMRSLQDHGFSYGVLKYYSKVLRPNSFVPVTINYLGQSDNTSSNNFENIEFLEQNLRAGKIERDGIIEINATIENGSLQIRFDFDSTQVEDTIMNRLFKSFISEIESIQRLEVENSKVLTPSDFDHICSQGDLEIITQKSSAENLQLESILPLSATQSALLLHSLQNQKNDQGLVIVTAELSGALDQQIFQDSWDYIVNKYEVLRSCLCWELTQNSYQLIYKSIKSQCKFIEQSTESNQSPEDCIIQNQFNKLDLSFLPSHKIACIKIDNSHHRIIFTCHHSYIDGWSTNLIFKDLIKTYTNFSSGNTSALNPSLILREWNQKYQQLKESNDFKDFWNRYLNQIKPTILKPKQSVQDSTFKLSTFEFNTNQLNQINSFIKNKKITTNIFFLGIWMWLLGKYTSEGYGTVGVTFSGRSMDINDIQKKVGMFSNMLPLSTQFDEDSINFEQIQMLFNDILIRDSIALADIELTSDNIIGELYDTMLIVQNFMDGSDAGDALTLKDFTSRISSLLPLCIIVLPDPELKFILRFDESFYKQEEIDNIATDITEIIKRVVREESLDDYEFLFKTTSEKSQPAESEAIDIKFHHLSDTRTVLLEIWKNLFKSGDIKQEDNFFDLGGTSLMAIRLFNSLNKTLGINLSPVLLLKNNTIELLASAIQSTHADETWNSVFPLKQNGKEAPLFCFHAGDGHILFYNELAQNIQSDRPVYGIQPVGLDGKEISFQSIEEMCAFYINEIKKKHPEGPYHLLGTCFSNAVTYEIAQKLSDEVKSVIIVDSPPPYFNELSKLSKWMNWFLTFNTAKIKEAIKSYFKYAKFNKPKDQQELNLFNTGKHLRSVLSNYKWTEEDIEIILLRSQQNDSDPYKMYHVINWHKLAKGGLIIKTIIGDHLDIFKGKSAKAMAKIIDELID